MPTMQELGKNPPFRGDKPTFPTAGWDPRTIQMAARGF